MLSEVFPWQTKAPWVHPNHATHPAKNDHFCRRPLSGTSCNFPATMSTNPSDYPPKKSEDSLVFTARFCEMGTKRDHFKKVGVFSRNGFWIQVILNNFDIWLDAPAILSGHWEYQLSWICGFYVGIPAPPLLRVVHCTLASDISLKEDSGQAKSNLPTYTEMGVISWMLCWATQTFTVKIAVSLKPILGWFPLLFHLLPRYQQQWIGPPCSQSLGHCHREKLLYSIFVVKVVMIALVEASPSGKLRLLEKHTFFQTHSFLKGYLMPGCISCSQMLMPKHARPKIRRIRWNLCASGGIERSEFIQTN